MQTTYEGLYPHLYDINTGKVEDDQYGWGGEFDSFYEYLIKQYVLSNGQDQLMKEMSIKATRGLKKHLLDTPEGFDQLKFIGSIDNNGNLNHVMGELGCFAPATLLLASHWIPELAAKTNDDDMPNVAHEILNGCYNTWISTRTSLSPEIFAWISKGDPVPNNLNTRQKELAKKYGVYPLQYDAYILRPGKINEAN